MANLLYGSKAGTDIMKNIGGGQAKKSKIGPNFFAAPSAPQTPYTSKFTFYCIFHQQCFEKLVFFRKNCNKKLAIFRGVFLFSFFNIYCNFCYKNQGKLAKIFYNFTFGGKLFELF